MKSILCPIDFSEASLNALEFAAQVGRIHESDIRFLNVLNRAEVQLALGETKPDRTYDELESRALEKLQNIVAETQGANIR